MPETSERTSWSCSPRRGRREGDGGRNRGVVAPRVRERWKKRESASSGAGVDGGGVDSGFEGSLRPAGSDVVGPTRIDRSSWP